MHKRFFYISELCARGHSLKLFETGCKLDCRKYTFAHRILEIWNSLDEDTVACDSLNGFKSGIDKFL
jgi:hypothetical protein